MSIIKQIQTVWPNIKIESKHVSQKDSYLIEANLFWINRWALIHIVVIVSCFLFQTYFIKSLFKTSRK